MYSGNEGGEQDVFKFQDPSVFYSDNITKQDLREFFLKECENDKENILFDLVLSENQIKQIEDITREINCQMELKIKQIKETYEDEIGDMNNIGLSVEKESGNVYEKVVEELVNDMNKEIGETIIKYEKEKCSEIKKIKDISD